jgi:hypothetical protein
VDSADATIKCTNTITQRLATPDGTCLDRETERLLLRMLNERAMAWRFAKNLPVAGYLTLADAIRAVNPLHDMNEPPTKDVYFFAIEWAAERSVRRAK